MQLEHYIAELLYRHNCVVVPNFGAFLVNTVSAQIDPKNHVLSPPKKLVSFNQRLSTNDGLLISHLAHAKKLTYDVLMEQVEQEVKRWTTKLEEGETLLLDGIGKLWVGKEEKILFSPEKTINYLTSSFGLSTFSISPISREKLKEDVVVLEERVPFSITPEKRETYGLRPFLKYAAIVLLTISCSISAYQFYTHNKNQQLLVVEEAQKQVTRHIQEATFFESTPLELPAFQLNIAKKETTVKHHIIAGAFRIRQNADKKIILLKQQGYQAYYVGTNAFGLHQVAYASFSDRIAALKFYRHIRTTISEDAWILSERKK
ncbi:MAG: SPOR domain-containing protein [Bacteroidota bacterium]